MSIIEKLNLEEKIGVENLDEKLDIIRKYQQYFFIGLTIIIALQLIFSLILPSTQNFSRKKIALDQYARSLNLRKKQAASKENVEQEENRLNTLLSNKKNLFFTKKEVEKFSISELPKIAQKFKINITNVNFIKSEKLSHGLTTYPLSIKASSNFFDLMQFIYQIEESQKTINIKTIKLTRKSLNPVMLNTTITLELFSLEGLK
ncbi:hypothetical protein CL647_01860 [bacterium]|nr:hypothetical protein [Actinomycetota bacterium]MBE32866.1 hypothetical protein [bacterium]|tara:strand:+ start:6755 stop:7366 length:612 start_codon:yes stop_codon:yes gene_type:complete